MSYYGRRRRRSNPFSPPPRQAPKPSGPPINVDIDTLLRGVAGSGPSHRALTTTPLTVTVQQTGYRGDRRWRRNIITLYNGRSKVETLEAGRIVVITYEQWGWRISTSATMEPTPLLLCQGNIPVKAADKIAESGGMVLYQTPQSMLKAAQYQATKGRRSISLATIDEAIALKGKHATNEQVEKISGKYKVFCALSATALSGSNSDSEGLIDAATNEARVAFPHAVKRGTQIIEGDWS